MKVVLGKVFKEIKKGWFISLISLGLLVGILYYLAPIISEERATIIRWSTACAALIIWLVFQLISLLRQRHQNTKIIEGLKEDTEVDHLQLEIDDEVDVLSEKLDNALLELQKGKVGKHDGDAKFLYQIPWFILIGPPASGKTTLLKNSRLKMALSKKFGRDAVAGVSGTRHCDWWFAEEAVLLDTAGRYTTQASHKEKDSQAWFRFLALLKEKRIRRPINGIIVAISLDEILEPDNMLRHAQEVRERIQELYEQLSVVLPVYLVFTKSDLLAGFSDFFDDLDEQARAQVWGTTFTQDNKVINKPLSILPKELDLLEDTLKDKLLYRLERETDLERRKVIYAFPEQFSSLKKALLQFTDSVFSKSRYQHEVTFRGVYFTSAEQTGNPIDKLLNNLSQTFGFSQAVSSKTRARGKSYFIDDLLQKVIFPESELASLNPSYERKKRILQRVSLSLAALIVGLGAAIWGVSYVNNQKDIDSLAEKTQKLELLLEENKKDKQLSTSLRLLNDAASLFHQEEKAFSDFGLGQQDKLQHEVANIYRQALHARLLPYVMESLERRLQNTDNDRQQLFESLKSYLILTPNHDQKYSDNVHVLQKLIEEDWQQQYRQDLSVDEFSQLFQHLEHLLERKPALARVELEHDATLIQSARTMLANSDLGNLVYLQIKREINRDQSMKEFVIVGRDASFRHAEKIFERRSGKLLTEGIQGEYTYEGYKAFDQRAKQLIAEYLKDDWVIGELATDNVADIYNDVRNRYLEDYQKSWDEYLADVKIKSPDSLEGASALLDILSRKDSALRNLLIAVAKETYLSRPIGPKGSKKRALKEAQRELIKKTGRVGSIGSNIVGVEAVEGLADQKGDDFVSVHFERLRMLAEQEQYKLEEIEKSFESLRIQIQEIEVSAPDDDLNATKKEVRKRLIDLKTLASQQPVVLRTWLHDFRLSIEGLLEGNLDSALNQKWKNNVYRHFQNKVGNKYPLSASQNHLIALGDFAAFFGPEGVMDRFFKENLASRIDRSGRDWKAVEFLGTPLSPEAIQQFRRAEKIRSAMFPNGERLPSIEFTIQPFEVSHDVKQVHLLIDGREMRHQVGTPIRPKKMKWPGESGDSFIQLDMLTLDNESTKKASNGEWALIDWLTRKGHLVSYKGHQFIATFQEGSTKVSFLITPTNSENLLTAVNELRKFRCPSSLIL